MRLVFISYLSVYERYIAVQLYRHFYLHHVACLLGGRPPGWKRDWREVARRPLRNAEVLLSGPLRDRRDRLYDAAGRARFFDCTLTGLDVGITEIPHWRINEPETQALLERLEPDVILVCSAPVLKAAIYEIPKVACLNIHYGITPRYRGEHTLFWPLLRQDYDNIGVTIHRIDQGIDTGSPLLRGHPALDPTDNEFTLRGKAAELAARMAIELLRDIQRGEGALALPDSAPPTTGKLYRLHDRTLFAGLRHQFQARILGKRPPRRPERIERLYRPSPPRGESQADQ